ncbi:hypothetical protein FACS1894196_2720 [Clostridia bacterium]|nr:hypothetical protein FACS1894196_2720 [Clostridia bacterium]
MKKTLLCCLLCLLMVMPLLSYAELSPIGTFPLTAERETLTILMHQDVLVEDYETNLFTKWVEDTCNVNLDFELLPGGQDGRDKLSIMLASGQKLPDIINISSSVLDDYIYGQAGIYLDLTEYFDTQAYYFKLRREEYPDIDVLSSITAADGKIYSLPYYANETIGNTNKRLWGNLEFLKALNLEIPTTTDEFYDVLVAIRDGDPNDNGLADEIPLLANDSSNLLGYLMSAFVYTSADQNYYLVNDGKVDVSYASPAFQEGLRFLYKLCKEGLLSPLTFTQTSDQFKQTVSGDEQTATIGFAIGYAPSTIMNNYATNPLVSQYEAVPPLTGPQGVRLTDYTPGVPTSQWHITKYASNPELAFRVGDLLSTEEAYLRDRFGIEGVNWRYVEDEQPSYYSGRNAKIENIEQIYMLLNNAMWRNNAPIFTYDDLDLRVWSGNPYDVTYMCAVSCPAYAECIPEEYITRLNFTPDEAEEINEIQSTLSSYVRESIARFVTGDLDIDKDWDAFQREVNAIGLPTFLEISQAAYDRLTK